MSLEEPNQPPELYAIGMANLIGNVRHKMKTVDQGKILVVSLDPDESDTRPAEPFLTYAIGKKEYFHDIEVFIVETDRSDVFGSRPNLPEVLSITLDECEECFIRAFGFFPQERSEVPMPITSVRILTDDCDYLDFVYEAASCFVRICWYTTA